MFAPGAIEIGQGDAPSKSIRTLDAWIKNPETYRCRKCVEVSMVTDTAGAAALMLAGKAALAQR